MSATLQTGPKLSSWHIAVAAEALTAAQFARCGFDVSVQYGANQPEYDLIVAKGDQMLKVSVKGSQDGRWGLTITGQSINGLAATDLRQYSALFSSRPQHLPNCQGCT